jgi:uncharacterized phiE125 gp8 family phage protein
VYFAAWRYDRDRLDALRVRGVSRLVTPPAIELISVEEFEAHARLEPDDVMESHLRAERLRAAREWVEAHTGRALLTQTWSWTVDRLPSWTAPILLPKVPLINVVSIITTDSVGTATTLAPANYLVDAGAEPGRLTLAMSGVWAATEVRPYSGLTVTYRAGYGEDPQDVPAVFHIAVLLLAAELHERREGATDLANLAEVPFGVHGMLEPYVVLR